MTHDLPDTDDGVDAPSLRQRSTDLLVALRRSLTASDVAAIAVLTASTLHLVAQDGGRNPSEALSALVVVALGTLVLLPGLRRLSRPAALLLAVWAIAPLIAVGAAEIRSGMARPLVVFAFAPAVVVATSHLWRRPWGPRVIGAILVLAVVRSWYGTFLAWWGGSTGRPTWLALSWHNQSGTLMGAAGVASVAVGAMLRGPSRIALVGLSGLCLAGAWLSGSRGAVVATIIGLLVVLVALARRRTAWRDLAIAVGALTAITAISVTALEAMVDGTAGQPLTSRSQSASHNLTARFGHWDAAVGMAASRPLTGWGPGSYRWASRDHYRLDNNLTASAHNEYIEVLGESGVVGAAPVWFGALAVGWFTLAAMWRRRSDLHGRLAERDVGVVAAAGAAAVLGLHAAIDFDWDYPVLLVLLAIAGAVLWTDRSAAQRAHPGVSDADLGASTRRLGRGLLVVTSAAIVAGLAGGLAAAAIRPSPAPWNLDGSVSAAVAAARDGDVPAARAALDHARTWNPGASSLPVVTAFVDHHAGDLSDAQLAAVVDPDHAYSSDHLLVAMRLVEVGAMAEASRVLDELVPLLEERRRWRVAEPVVQAAGLRLAIAASEGGCASAEALAPELVAWAETFGAEPAHIRAAFDGASPVAGCELSALRDG